MVDSPPVDPTLPTAPILPDAEAMHASAVGIDNVRHSLNGMTQQVVLTSNATGALTAVALGTTNAFAQLGAAIDTTRLNTFEKQIDALTEDLSRQGTAVGTMAKGIGLLRDVILRAGGSSSEVGNIFRAAGKDTALLVGELASYAKTVLKVADDQLKLQNATIQQMAAQGNLTALYGKAGYDLSNMNNMIAKQTEALNAAQKATGIDIRVLATWQSELNRVPGIQKNVIDSTGKFAEAQKFFTRTIEFAIGSGRTYSSVVDDMNKAIKEYGVSQEEAFKFTGRMTEAAELLQIPVDDLRAVLNSSADAFKMFATGGQNAANITQGMQQSMVEYIQSLRDVQVPMSNAISLAQNFAGAVSNMSLAQKSFLSAQTGGAGGLMGAFQIDKMLKEGNIKGVFDRVRQSITRELGHIVTVDEAAQSQAAAEQMTRQILILKQGPLGQFAKTDAEAERLLEAMQKGNVPDHLTKELGQTGNLTLERAIEQGTKIQQISDSTLSEILKVLREMQLSAAAPTLGFVQQGTARSGARSGAGAGINPELQEHLRSVERTGISPSRESFSATALKDLKNLPEAVSLAAKAFVSSLAGGNTEEVLHTSKAMDQSLINWRESISKMPEERQKIQNKAADSASVLFNSAIQDAASSVSLTPQSANFTNLGEYSTAGTQVGNAIPPAKSGTGVGNVSSTPTSAYSPQQPVPVTLVAGSGITVNFTGKCPHCGWNQQHSELATILNAPSQIPR